MKKGKLLKIGSVVVIVFLGVVAMTALGSTQKSSNKRPPKNDVRTVEVQGVDFKDITLEIEGNGLIESQKTLEITAEASGRVVYANNDLKNGTFVKKGDVILNIDQREVKNNLFSLRSDFLNAVAAIIPEMKIEDESIYNKWMTYFKSINIDQDVPDLPQISNSQEKIKLSTKQVFRKFYTVKNQEILLTKHTILAPFDGFIQSQGIIQDSYVSRGQKLLTFNDVQNLEIAVPLLVDEFNNLDFSSRTNVKIISTEKEYVLTGYVSRRDPKLDRNSQSLNVYVSFRNDKLNPLFSPGNYVDVKIEGKSVRNVAVIPRYVINNEGFVYTMSADSTLGKAKVDLVTMQETNAVIEQTIPKDTKIVTTVLQRPLIGMKIKTLDKEAKLARQIKKEASDNTNFAALNK